MGVAFGRFIPAEGFDAFIRTVPPDIADGDRVQIWNELAARTSKGVVHGADRGTWFKCACRGGQLG